LLNSTKQKVALRSRYVIDLYKKEHGVEEVNPSAVTDWAIERGIWKPFPVDPARQLRQDLVRALRAETVTDSKGREIRKNHPVVMTDGERRFSVWAEITTATPKHMQTSLQQRRNGILADCRQHRLDFNFYNENNVRGGTLKPFEYNFAPDLDEMDFPSEYPDDKPQ
jgi:hypothetical protein